MGTTDAVAVVREDTAVAPREEPGMLAMARMSEGEFEARLAALKKGQERLKRIKQELMEQDAHYGVIPGTKKPTLLKPGAEVLCSIYGLRPNFIPTIEIGDGEKAPTIRVTMRCELHLGDLSGPVVAVGYGEANSWERKHRYRRGERVCPKCGVVGHIIKGKDEYGGGWLCWKSKGGCGAKFADGAPEIENQQCGDVDNPDPFDLTNTLVKMAKKRSHIDAALTGTASSDLFTQDLEDPDPERERGNGRKPTPPVVETSVGPVTQGRGEHAAEAGADDYEPEPGEDGDETGARQDTKVTVAVCPHCNSMKGVVSDGPGWWRCKKCRKGFRRG